MQKTNESGRSMVEMLGVLAIIGVLSVGGVAGYQYAMDTLKTNNILYGLNKMAHTCVAQMGMQARECSLAEYGQQLENYPIEMVSFSKQNYFGIKVSNVPESICKKIHITGFPISSLILPATCEGTKDMVFIFNQNLTSDNSEGPTVCSDESHCGDCEQCSENGICESSCGTDQTCAKDFEDPSAPKSCCPTGNLVGGVCCNNPDGYGNCCDSKGGNCCPPDKPMMTVDGVCRSCDDTTYNTVVNKTINFSSTCSRCPDRELKTSWYVNEYCSVKSCPKETPLQNYKGQCLSCDVSEQYVRDPDSWKNYNNSCSLCSNRGEAGRSSTGVGYVCIICPEDSFVGLDGRCSCPSEKPLLAEDGCHACDENVRIKSLKGEGSSFCSVCPNRTKFPDCCRDIAFCGLTECSENQIHDHKGLCYDCSSSNSILMKSPNGPYYSPDSCSECKGLRYTEGNYCKKCPADISNLTAEQQAECSSNS